MKARVIVKRPDGSRILELPMVVPDKLFPARDVLKYVMRYLKVQEYRTCNQYVFQGKIRETKGFVLMHEFDLSFRFEE